MRFNWFVMVAMAWILSACTATISDTDRGEDHIVGKKLAEVSSLTSELGADEDQVAIYDGTVQMIHQFDLRLGRYQRSLRPRSTGAKNYVLFAREGGFVVHLTEKRLSIFNRDGKVQEQPIQFSGTPVSAAFRPKLGYLVIWDDLQSAGILKMDAAGNVQGATVLGPVVTGNVSISAGDINDRGELILALNDDSIAVVDLAQTIATQRWQFTRFTTAMSGISWVAPLHDHPEQVLVHNSSKIAIVDTAAGTVTRGFTVEAGQAVLMTSKTFDPHILISRSWIKGTAGSDMTIVYGQNSEVLTKKVYYQANTLLSSRLSLSGDSWSLVDSLAPRWIVGMPLLGWLVFDDPNANKSQRVLKRYRFSNLLATGQLNMPDNAQLEVTEQHVFQLFPSKLGYAVNTEINSGAAAPITLFNKPFLH